MPAQALFPGFWFWFMTTGRTKPLSQGPAPGTDRSDVSDLEFINEMILRNPDAFRSDDDVMAMMSMFPGRF